MGDKIASLYAEIGADTSKLDKGLKDVAGKLQDGQKKFTGLTDAANALAVPMAGAAMGAAALGAAISVTAGETVKYAKEVRDLSRNIGASAEESSKLIQAADDVGISVGTLTGALNAAIRNGTKPTIENIAALADEYNKLQPGVERTEFLMKRFGRSGAELGPLMEQGAAGIRAAGQEAENLGLVLSDKDVASARQFEVAMDGLGDAVSSVKYGVGNALIPVLTDAANALNVMATASRTLKAALAEHDTQVKATAASAADYNTEIIRAHRAAGELVTDEGVIIDAYGRKKGQLDLLTEAQIKNQQAVANLTADDERAAMAQEAVTTKTNAALDAWAAAQTEIGDVAAATRDVTTAQQEHAQAILDEQTKLDILSASFGALTAEVLFNQMASSLDAQGQLELARQLGRVNEQTYAGLTAAEQLKEKYDKNHDGAISAGEGARQYAAELAALKANIDGLQDKTVTIRVVQQGDVGQVRTDTSAGAQSETRRAAGGPVTAGRPYIWNEAGRGEVLVPAGNGYVLTKSDAQAALAGAGGGGGDMAGILRQFKTDIIRGFRDALLTVR